MRVPTTSSMSHSKGRRTLKNLPHRQNASVAGSEIFDEVDLDL
jgi:hypothetical protein